MSFLIGEIVANVRADSGQFRREMGNVQRTGATASRNTQRSLGGIGQKLTSIAFLAKTAFGSALVMGARQAVREFAMLEGAMAKFNVVFGDQARDTEAWIDTLRQRVPLARRELIAAAASMQDLLVPMGVAREEATGMTKEWLELAAALAAFNDVPVDQALEAIRSGIAGQSRPLRQFGIDARETALQQTALAEGLIDAGDQMNDQVRQQALLIQSYRQSSDAIDGYEDQLGSTLMKEQELTATFRDTQAALGRQLQPAYNALLGVLNEVLTAHETFSTELRGIKLLFTELPGPIKAVTDNLDEYVEALRLIERYSPIQTGRNLLGWFRNALNVTGQLGEATDKLADEYRRYQDQIARGVELTDDQEVEQVEALARAVNNVRVAVENIKPVPEIFDPTDAVIARIMQEDFKEFEDTLYHVARQSEDFSHRLEQVKEKSEEATGAGQYFSRTLADGLDQILFRARSVEDAIKGIVRQLASRALTTGIMGLLGGGFGAGGFLGAMFGGNRQSGGGVNPGRGYIVGERGPELFLPQSSGTIVPNDMGSKTINLNVHVKGGTGFDGRELRYVIDEQIRQSVRLQ